MIYVIGQKQCKTLRDATCIITAMKTEIINTVNHLDPLYLNVFVKF